MGRRNRNGVRGACGAHRCYEYDSYSDWYGAVIDDDPDEYDPEELMDPACKRCHIWSNQVDDDQIMMEEGI